MYIRENEYLTGERGLEIKVDGGGEGRGRGWGRRDEVRRSDQLFWHTKPILRRRATPGAQTMRRTTVIKGGVRLSRFATNDLAHVTKRNGETCEPLCARARALLTLHIRDKTCPGTF